MEHAVPVFEHIVEKYGLAAATAAMLGGLLVFLVYWLTQSLSENLRQLGERIDKNSLTLQWLALVIAKANNVDVEETRRMSGNGTENTVSRKEEDEHELRKSTYRYA